MARKPRRKQEDPLNRPAAVAQPSPETPRHDWPGERSRYLAPLGAALTVLLSLIVYGQTLSAPPMEFDDTFYLMRNPYVNVARPLSMLGPVWTAYRALANLHYEAGDYRAALALLKQAQRMDPVASRTNNVDRDIGIVEGMLGR